MAIVVSVCAQGWSCESRPTLFVCAALASCALTARRVAREGEEGRAKGPASSSRLSASDRRAGWSLSLSLSSSQSSSRALFAAALIGSGENSRRSAGEFPAKSRRSPVEFSSSLLIRLREELGCQCSGGKKRALASRALDRNLLQSSKC